MRSGLPFLHAASCHCKDGCGMQIKLQPLGIARDMKPLLIKQLPEKASGQLPFVEWTADGPVKVAPCTASMQLLPGENAGEQSMQA